MPKYTILKLFTLQDVPEFQEFQANNPHNIIDEAQTAVMFCRAVHWMSIYQILWPPFAEIDFYYIGLDELLAQDPDRENISILFYKQIAEAIKTFWTIQLTDLYPQGDWEIVIHEGAEAFIQATIRK